MEIKLQEGDCDWLRVDRPPHNLLDTGPVFLPHHQILGSDLILSLVGQVG